jgi:hypothetical protein
LHLPLGNFGSNDLIDQAELKGLFRGHVAVFLAGYYYLFFRFAGSVFYDLVYPFLAAFHIFDHFPDLVRIFELIDGYLFLHADIVYPYLGMQMAFSFVTGLQYINGH